MDNSLINALAAGKSLKTQPIPAGHVLFERHDYHYGRQGQVTLTGYRCQVMPEHEAVTWIAGAGYSPCSVTWPDGYSESFENHATPARHYPHAGFGTIQREGRKERTQVKLSRLRNLATEYYGVRSITEAERLTFIEHKFDCETNP